MQLNTVFRWCGEVLDSIASSGSGQVEILADHSKEHGGHESSTFRIRTSEHYAYVKVHESAEHWHNEVHGYEQWARAFGKHAPQLLAVRDEAPLALVVSELPGLILENQQLIRTKEQTVWRAAGAALVSLHDLPAGKGFGRCLRDGSFADVATTDAIEYVGERLSKLIEQAVAGAYVDENELATLRAAQALVPIFADEHPCACHRDYCAANWLVNAQGHWTGVIDFEFAHWDVRVADFARDPHWNWIHRPDLVDAFFDGYGLQLTPRIEQQLLVARAEYALDAIVWGRDNAFYGFECEGREALAFLAPLLA